jgi:oxygen-independent coproporphyrinogen-3 oxidase
MKPFSPPLFGVYVHFPFCRRRCPYCDFTISIWSELPHHPYADAVCRELAARSSAFPGRTLHTLSFGGGTPGAWAPDALGRVVRAAQEQFGTAREVSCEANPEDASEEHFAGLRAAGVTRLSLGVQSFDTATLHGLGRQHTPEQARASAHLAAKHFPSVSLDLIAGGPGSTRESFANDLQTALSLGVSHLSVYGLTIEEGTLFAKQQQRGQLRSTDEDEIGERLELAQSVLCGAGFVHYEISNYARPGSESLHNSLYWTAGEYLGLGCGAHSFSWKGPAQASRAVVVKGASEYMRRATEGRSTLLSQEESAGESLYSEMILSRLRHREGLPLAWFASVFGVDLIARGGARLQRAIAAGFVEQSETHLFLTARGKFAADEVTWALIETPSEPAARAFST